MDISVVVPLFDEEESLPKLVEWIHKVMQDNQFSYELLLVNDGSNDNSWAVIRDLTKKYASVKGISFRRNYGKSAALQVGFEHSLGDIVITMDADLQDSPDEIPELYKMIKEEGFDLVSGWKKKRHDPLSKTIPTKLFNAATRKISGIYLHDFNCGLKAYKKEVIKSIEVYGEMHRYIPVLAKWAGFKNIGEKVVQHRARQFGVTKFGLERFVNGFLDLLSISFVGKFSKRPMHFFGALGSLFSTIGVLILLALSLEKLFSPEYSGGLANRPLFFASILSLIVGVQLFTAGFLGELISRNSPDRNKYLIDEKTFD